MSAASSPPREQPAGRPKASTGSTSERPGTIGCSARCHATRCLREDLLENLLAGPNEDELDQQYTTFLPPDLQLLDTFKQGTILFLDVSEQLTQVPAQPLAQALAQIVYTATELEGVERVQLTVNGAPVSWPRPVGGNTSGTLSIYDYPGFVQSAQPAFPALPAGA